MTEKVKKPFYKKWWVWVLAVIIIGAIASNGEDTTTKTSTKVETTTAQPAEKEKPAAAPKKEEPKQEAPKNEPTITKDEFNQIKNGMTYEQVVQIIGGEGELNAESGEGQFHTAVYSWQGDDGISNATVTFQGNPLKVQAKAQIGLQ